METIGNQAFRNCQNVWNLIIPSSVKTLGTNVFENLGVDILSIAEDLYLSSPSAFTDFHFNYLSFLQPNPAKISGKTATVKAKSVKKKAQTVAASKVYKVSPSTGVNAVKVSGSKNITVNRSNGSITVKKKTKKGTYKIKVKVMSTGNAEYKASGWKTVTIKIKVK